MKILCLSGWAQNHEFFLKDLAQIIDPASLPSSSFASTYKTLIFKSQNLSFYSFDYLICESFGAFCEELRNLQKTEGEFDGIIGWSLGGQLAMQLLAKEILKPKFLILIAAPFQLVGDELVSDFKKTPEDKRSQVNSIKSGNHSQFQSISKEQFLAIRSQIENYLITGLARFTNLASLGGSREERIKMKSSQILAVNGQNLIFWLDWLGEFKASALPHCNWPKTLIIHGQNDQIIHHSQSQMLSKLIPSAQIELFKNCAHNPLFNDSQHFLSSVRNFLSDFSLSLKIES